MKLPATFDMQPTGFGDGRRGYAWQRSRDVDGLGVVMSATRDSYGKAFIETWTSDWLPERPFGSLQALRAALEPLTDEAIAAERAKYPRVRTARQVVARDYANKCRLCPSSDPDTPRRNGVLEVYIALSWRVEDVRYTELCAVHQHLAADVTALMAALDAEVANRKALGDSLGATQ